MVVEIFAGLGALGRMIFSLKTGTRLGLEGGTTGFKVVRVPLAGDGVLARLSLCDGVSSLDECFFRGRCWASSAPRLRASVGLAVVADGGCSC